MVDFSTKWSMEDRRESFVRNDFDENSRVVTLYQPKMQQ